MGCLGLIALEGLFTEVEVRGTNGGSVGSVDHAFWSSEEAG